MNMSCPLFVSEGLEDVCDLDINGLVAGVDSGPELGEPLLYVSNDADRSEALRYARE